MENSVIGHTTPAAGDVGGTPTSAESGTGIWDVERKLYSANQKYFRETS